MDLNPMPMTSPSRDDVVTHIGACIDPSVPGVQTGAHGDHIDAEYHHHHSHAASSHHPGHHHLLTVEDLTVAFDAYDSGAPFWRAGRVRQEVLHGLTLSVHEGEILAVVGASGSGKTVLADALLGLYEPNVEVRGRIWFDGEAQDAAGLARLRGCGISLVPQSVTHLDPLMRVGEQVCGVPRGVTHAERAADAARRAERRSELFEAYGLSPEIARMYPHQLSGGMARRVLLMCVLMESPRLIIADEPTPGLDLELAVHAVDDLRAFANTGGGVLLITHDLELALRVADRVAVFKDGTIVEETSAGAFLEYAKLGNRRAERPDNPAGRGSASLRRNTPTEYLGAATAGTEPGEQADLLRHPFSRALALSIPSHMPRITAPEPIAGAQTVLTARDLFCAYPGAQELFGGLSFDIMAGERVALEAPSGAGKTTLCKVLAGYLDPRLGSIEIDGVPLGSYRRRKGQPMPVQLIAQHPEQAFDPRMRMADSLSEAGDMQGERARMLLDRFGVKDEWLARMPHELSGGELMRFCLVRALMVRPRVLICDESTAMLDLVTQAVLWRAICELQEHERFALVFVSHSAGLVRWLATRRIALALPARFNSTRAGL